MCQPKPSAGCCYRDFGLHNRTEQKRTEQNKTKNENQNRTEQYKTEENRTEDGKKWLKIYDFFFINGRKWQKMAVNN